MLVQFYYNFESLFFKLIPAKKEKTILFTKIDAIGDFVIWMDVAESLRNSFKNYKISIIINSICFDLVSKTNYFDEIICIDKKKWLNNPIYRFNFIKNFSKRKFEKILNPIFSRDYYYQDQLVRILKSNQKIGYLSDYINNKNTLKGLIKNENLIDKINLKQFNKGNRYYTRLIQPDIQFIMEKSRNAHFVRETINSNFQSHIPSFPYKLPEISSFTTLQDKNYVIIFIGASTHRKIWPANNYIELIRSLSRENIVICGGKGEENIWDQILSEDKDHVCKNVYNFIGKTDLIQLFSLIKSAKWIITNDTSASHICVVTQTPSICILGGAHFGRFQPYFLEKKSEQDQLPKIVNYYMDCYNCNLNCIYIKKSKNEVWPCIRNIKVQSIINQINNI